MCDKKLGKTPHFIFCLRIRFVAGTLCYKNYMSAINLYTCRSVRVFEHINIIYREYSACFT